MRGDEVIERATSSCATTASRRRAAGSVAIPDDARDRRRREDDPAGLRRHPRAHLGRVGRAPLQVSQFLAQLAYGVTTQRDPQTSSEDVLSYFDLMEVGELIGPRIYSTGPGIFSRDIIRSLDDARDVLRRYADHFNTQTIKQYLAGDRKVRQWVITAARELGLTPTTEGGELHDEPHAHAGRLRRARALAADQPVLRRRGRADPFSGITYTPTLIVAYGGPSGLQLLPDRTRLRRGRAAAPVHAARRAGQVEGGQFYRDDQYVHPLHAEQLRRSSRPAAASVSARTARCRAWARTGSCG
jgi:hypothetical protein